MAKGAGLQLKGQSSVLRTKQVFFGLPSQPSSRLQTEAGSEFSAPGNWQKTFLGILHPQPTSRIMKVQREPAES
jgi:hypothetical protein